MKDQSVDNTTKNWSEIRSSKFAMNQLVDQVGK